MSPDPAIGASSPSDPLDGDPSGAQPSVPELDALARFISESRQAQGLSVVELAQRLHMGLEQLKALERGDQQHLPEPVFVIAQARRVADALGIEISAHIEALRSSERFMNGGTSYWPALRADVFQAARARQGAAEGPRAKAKVKPGIKPETAPNKADTKAKPMVQPQPAPFRQANLPHPSKPQNIRPAPSSGPASPKARAQAARALAWLLLLAGVGAAGAWGWQQRQAAQPALASALLRWSSWVEASRRAVSPPPQVKPQQPAAKAVRPQELQVMARQPSWLEVRPAAGGQPLFLGTFIGERRFPLAAGLRLRAGRPDLVLVSDGSAPPKPLGTISEIRWVSFNLPQAPKARSNEPIKPAPLPPPLPPQS